MLLGDIISRFQDEAAAAEALLSLGDLPLAARVLAAAAQADAPPGEFASELVGRFVRNATDEEWLTLIGLMARSDDPARAFMRQVLSNAIGNHRAGH